MPELRDFDALVFDCYGTLIDWESGLWAAFEPWLERRGVSVEREAALEVFGRCEAAQEAETPDLLYREILRRVHGRLAAEWGVESSAEEAEAFALSVRDWPPFADSPAALGELAGRYRLAILSNVDRESFAFSRRALATASSADPFSAVFTAEEIGSYKPDRRNFEHMIAGMRRLGVEPERILHVAQSVFHDLVPAAELGLATCWIDRRGGQEGWGATPPPRREVEIDFRFGSLAELAAEVRRQETAPG